MAGHLLTQEEISRLKNLKGEIRGSAIKEDFKYIEEREGPEAVLKLEEELRLIGCPIDYKKTSTTRWYPVGLRAISLLIIKKLFSYQDEDIIDMGRTAPKQAFFFAKLATIPFSTSLKALKLYPERLWKAHYSLGEINNIEFDEQKKYLIMRITGFDVHSVLCKFLEGYMVSLASFVIKSNNINIKESRCPFRGDTYHEFTLWWE